MVGEFSLVRSDELLKIRLIADYQFGRGMGRLLFPDDVTVTHSRTGRIRQIFEGGKRLATLRARDGMLTLSIRGAVKLHTSTSYPTLRVVASGEAAPFVAEGRTLFAKHVIDVDPEIRSGEEVLIVNESDDLLGVGKALLAPAEMLSAMRGVGVETRSGVGKIEE
ncbi:tRNA-guanine(15) transglycosylase [Candidatus Methanoperedenaceae archaeon GB37]|nr:tRNA-guanine(15) transglycosylase [Candidatus Methanoperedenaceae archaeon GB37]